MLAAVRSVCRHSPVLAEDALQLAFIKAADDLERSARCIVIHAFHVAPLARSFEQQERWAKVEYRHRRLLP